MNYTVRLGDEARALVAEYRERHLAKHGVKLSVRQTLELALRRLAEAEA